MADFNLQIQQPAPPTPQKPIINWRKASEKALESYNNLAEKLCSKTLRKYKKGEINGVDMHKEVVNNISCAAVTCLPKFKTKTGPRRHNIPLWRERECPTQKRC